MRYTFSSRRRKMRAEWWFDQMRAAAENQNHEITPPPADDDAEGQPAASNHATPALDHRRLWEREQEEREDKFSAFFNRTGAK